MKEHESTQPDMWQKVKSEVRKVWGKLTDDELEKTKGEMDAIGSLIEKRYGETKKNYGDKLTGIMERFEDKTHDAAKQVNSSVKS